MYLTSSKDSLIQRNVLEHIGTCGIELYFADNIAVQYNEISDVVKKAHGADDNAIDPDWRVTNALIQYNYVHNCGEGFLLCGVAFNSDVFRYNLVQDCGRSYVHYSMGSGYFQLYNNVFYRSKDGKGTDWIPDAL
ncbi:MAG: right-handed parallel beta-helix repeat-containing protein [Coprococcus sp.]|nr:right-handed parallel beta-helix repeat-containing protein [Coprococcus sp.]